MIRGEESARNSTLPMTSTKDIRGEGQRFALTILLVRSTIKLVETIRREGPGVTTSRRMVYRPMNDVQGGNPEHAIQRYRY